MPAMIYDTTLKAWEEVDMPRLYDASQKAFREYTGKIYVGGEWRECFRSSDVVVTLDIGNGYSLSGVTVQLRNASNAVLATATANSNGVAIFKKPNITKGTRIRAFVASWDANNVRDTYSDYITYLVDKGNISLHVISYTGIKQINSYDKIYIGSWNDMYNVHTSDFEGTYRVPDGIEPISTSAVWQYYSDSAGRWENMSITASKMDRGSKDRFGYPTEYYYDRSITNDVYYSSGPWRFQAYCTANRYEKVWS